MTCRIRRITSARVRITRTDGLQRLSGSQVHLRGYRSRANARATLSNRTNSARTSHEQMACRDWADHKCTRGISGTIARIPGTLSNRTNSGDTLDSHEFQRHSRTARISNHTNSRDTLEPHESRTARIPETLSNRLNFART